MGDRAASSLGIWKGRLFAAVASIWVIECLADVALRGWPAGNLWVAEFLIELLHGAVLLAAVWYFTDKLRGLVDDVHSLGALQSRLTEISSASLRNRLLRDLETDAITALVECAHAKFAVLGKQADWELVVALGRDADGTPLDGTRLPLLRNLGDSERLLRLHDVDAYITISPFLGQGLTHLFVKPIVREKEQPEVLLVGFSRAPRTVALQIAIRVAAFLGHAFQFEKLREAQRLSETMFQQIAENIEEVFYVSNPPMTHLHYISPAYEKIWGKSLESLYKNPESWMDSICEEDRHLAAEAVGPMKETGHFDRTYRILTDAGHVRWIRDRAFPVYDKFGDVERIAGIAADITPIKDADEQRLKSALATEHRAREDAELELRIRNDVLAMVSHDLRAPLTTISMVVEKILRTASADERTSRSLERARRSADYMNRLVEDLLDTTRLRAGKLVLDRTHITVAALLQEVHDVYMEPCSRKDIAFHVDYGPADLPNLSLDRTRMLQVFGNLVSNAIKFTPMGGRITVSAALGCDEVVFLITDTGRGIPTDEIPHLFELFWQKAGDEKRGLGLGLPIVKGIIEAHGGRIQVESQQGVGTTIRLEIPTGEDASVHSADQAQAHSAAEALDSSPTSS